MTRTPPLRASLLASSLLTTGFQATTASPYFGQPVPGLTPALFASSVVSTDAIELNGRDHCGEDASEVVRAEDLVPRQDA